jgi:hypothetical protein
MAIGTWRCQKNGKHLRDTEVPEATHLRIQVYHQILHRSHKKRKIMQMDMGMHQHNR